MGPRAGPNWAVAGAAGVGRGGAGTASGAIGCSSRGHPKISCRAPRGKRPSRRRARLVLHRACSIRALG